MSWHLMLHELINYEKFLILKQISFLSFLFKEKQNPVLCVTWILTNYKFFMFLQLLLYIQKNQI